MAVIYEFACAMARRGHEVHLYHVNFFMGDIEQLSDIDWFEFSGGVHHHFAPPEGVDLSTVPRADVMFGMAPSADVHSHVGLPVVLIQGHKMLGERIERDAYTAPCPKVCVASWLLDVGREFGVPERELLHVAPGLRHEKYRLQLPLVGRPPRVSFCYSSHWQKGAELAIAVLEEVRAIVPEVDVVAFGAADPEHEIPSWMTYRTNPSQQEIVDDIYNTSRIFLCTSVVEGFGLPNIEAMACGAALVTTDNGGSRDYAIDGQTALVASSREVEPLVDLVVALLRDDERRVEIARAGGEYVRRFDWERSAEELERFLESYVGDPAAYGWVSEVA